MVPFTQMPCTPLPIRNSIKLAKDSRSGDSSSFIGVKIGGNIPWRRLRSSITFNPLFMRMTGC